jgi:hypothetical protein
MHVEPLARRASGGFRFLAFGDVGPRADDLDRLTTRVANNLLPVVEPDEDAVAPVDAILDGTLIALEHLLDPSVDAVDIVGMDPVAPKVRIGEIVPWGAAEHALDTVAHKGGLKVAGRRPAIDHRGRCVEQPSEMGVG